MSAYAHALTLEQPSYQRFDLHAATPTYAHVWSRADYDMSLATPNALSSRRADVLAAAACRARSRHQAGAAAACVVAAGLCALTGLAVAAVPLGLVGAALAVLSKDNDLEATELLDGPSPLP